MTYEYLIEKLKGDGELRFHRELSRGRETVELFWDEENEQEEVPKKILKRFFKNNGCREQLYAMQGNEETGWYLFSKKNLK